MAVVDVVPGKVTQTFGELPSVTLSAPLGTVETGTALDYTTAVCVFEPGGK